MVKMRGKDTKKDQRDGPNHLEQYRSCRWEHILGKEKKRLLGGEGEESDFENSAGIKMRSTKKKGEHPECPRKKKKSLSEGRRRGQMKRKKGNRQLLPRRAGGVDNKGWRDPLGGNLK